MRGLPAEKLELYEGFLCDIIKPSTTILRRGLREAARLLSEGAPAESEVNGMSEERKEISVEDLVDEDLINRDFFLQMLGAVSEKKRILLIGQPGAHGLTTLATALLVHGDTVGFKYEIFDTAVAKPGKEPSEKQYFAHIREDDDIYTLLSLWANGSSGVATIYADSVRDALDRIEANLKKHGIADATAFVNFTVDVICMIENEDKSCETSVVRDVIVQHH